MKNKQIVILILALLLCAQRGQAENVIEVVPLVTTAGITADDGECISFEMTNDEANIVGLSFLVKLPDGMKFDDSDLENYPPFEMVLDRFPFTGRGNNKQYQHSVSCNLQDDGWWMVVVSSTALNPIKDLSGVILQGYYETASTMEPGVYPILMKDIKMAISGTQKADAPEVAVSYVTIADNNGDSPIATESHVDLSSLTGYVPSFVVNGLNTELAGNEQLVSVDLSGATALGADLEVGENVLWCTSADATLNRTFKGGQWQTACLPFDVSEEQVAALKDAGCEIEQLSAYDEATNTVTFSAADAMTAHKPYIVKTTEAAVLFSGIEGATIDFTATPEDVTFGRVTMRGTYTPQTFDSDETQTYFAYDDADGAFVRIGRNLKVSPFRAYIVQQSKSAQSRMIVVHDNESGIPTGIESIASTKQQTGLKYNLQGQRVDTMKKGVYVVNGRKVIK